jgi:hypothetical protein
MLLLGDGLKGVSLETCASLMTGEPMAQAADGFITVIALPSV